MESEEEVDAYALLEELMAGGEIAKAFGWSVRMGSRFIEKKTRGY